MFRAELNRFADGSVLKIEGRLVGDWADEVKSLLSQGPIPKGLIVDITEVSYVDAIGEQVLTWLSSLGARFVARAVYAAATCKRLKLALHNKPIVDQTRVSGRAGDARYGLMKEGMSMLFHGKFQNRNVHFREASNVALLVVVLAIVSLAMSGCKMSHAAIPQIITEVQVAQPIQRDVPVHNEWVATLDGYVNAEIHPQVSGYIIRQDYKEGSVVRKGQVLFEIDPRPFQATLDLTKGELAQAEALLVKSTHGRRP